MKNLKKILCIFLITLPTTIFGTSITDKTTPITPLEDIDQIQPESLSPRQEQLWKDMADLNPNFLTELNFEMNVTPGQEDIVLSEITEVLTDYSRYDKIPYYSKHNGTWNKLFEEIQYIDERIISESETEETLFLRMRPFEPGNLHFTMDRDSESIVFNCTNQDPMYYSFVKAIKPNRMRMTLVVEKSPGKLHFFGLGGAKAFAGFGSIKDRMEVAFNGRIEAFFLWISEIVIDPVS